MQHVALIAQPEMYSAWTAQPELYSAW
jgi:hypothetical protein